MSVMRSSNVAGVLLLEKFSASAHEVSPMAAKHVKAIARIDWILFTIRATVLDPTDPTVFWTSQEYTVAEGQWGVKVAAIRAASLNDDEFLLIHNPRKPMDVTGDGHVAPGDALAVVNYLNAFGSKPVPPDALGGPYCDVNGDGRIAPNDALVIINAINAGQVRRGRGRELCNRRDSGGGHEKRATLRCGSRGLD
jgi:hypothetical protein